MTDILHSKNKLFPLLNSFDMTRVILSYLDPMELETTVKLLNKWSYNFIKSTPNISLLYGRHDFRAISISQDHTLNILSIEENQTKLKKSEIANFPKELSKFSYLETPENKIFILGGYDNNLRQVVSFLYEINEEENAANLISTTHYPRISFSFTIFNKCIYLIGGYNAGVLKICEKIELKSQRWRSVPSLNMRRCNPILCVFSNNFLYAFGGTDGYSPLGSVERLGSNSKQWEILPDFCNDTTNAFLRVGGHAQQISKKEIMIFGGHSRTRLTPINACAIYRVDLKKIINSVEFKEAENEYGIHMEHEKIYAIGEKKVHVYDCREKLWKLLECN